MHLSSTEQHSRQFAKATRRIARLEQQLREAKNARRNARRSVAFVRDTLTDDESRHYPRLTRALKHLNGKRSGSRPAKTSR